MGGQGMQIDVGSIHAGDRLLLVGQPGLAKVTSEVYAIKVADGEVEVSREPNGAPLTDVAGQPRHYPARIFKKIP